MNSIQVNGISKAYGKVQAVQDIHLDIQSGELFGLIGPDGAGKTTLFRILATLLLADAGDATVAGWDVVRDFRQIRRHLGYMPGRFSLYQDLTVEENLRFFATIFGTSIEENYDLIKDIYQQIEPFRKRRAGQLSGGMKQKLALSCALIHAPRVLFLDEPTTGVDAVSRQEFWEMLQRLKAKNITILVSTPYMDEAQLCDRIGLIRQGRILSVAPPDELTAAYPHPLFEVGAQNRYQLLQDLREYSPTRSVFPFGEFLHLSTRHPVDPMDIREFLAARQHREVVVRPTEATVEDCFMNL
ncbi:ABC transporter ATP-binding protein [Flavilitoribacter nigricans]|uniref:ATPase n=1 Tax=Flavilitoribacter nigricans (strain ATCC 23147 / DSM 23189 / NBRC 102662 / NCIMB 1420 / SS-2) TaxID=1122177 RepID=A0A2D0N492_FLAN2|nr:ABC transporter ATP-binding protein [Flavilitoribacter nigricans]PHN03208.1 ATPase [Flavilitoribacter nigricans DSM 23189 = NBRC 102662]